MEPAPEQNLPSPKPAPVMDVVPPPTDAAPTAVEPLKVPPPDPTAQPASTPEKKEAKKPPAKAAKPDSDMAGAGIGLAVMATVIIVAILGAMMVYAFLRTNGVNAL